MQKTPTLEHIPRPRINEILSAYRRHRVTVVSAPPGYGKTVAVQQFIRSTGLQVVWQAVDQHERDGRTLHLRLLQSFGSTVPGIQGLPDTSSPAALAEAACQYLDQHMDERYFYVLDDIHHVNGSPSGEQWLESIIQNKPKNCYLILISRDVPSLPYAELLSKNDLLTVSADHLRFDVDEVRELAGLFEAQVDTSALQQTLDGWAAGLNLAMRPASRGVVLPDADSRITTPQDLFDTFIERTLQYQPVELTIFLMATAVPRKFNERICLEILHLTDIDKHMHTIRQQNMFIHEVAGGYSYHGLFRDYLLERLMRNYPDMYRDLNLLVGERAEQRQNFAEAIEHYLQAGMTQQAADVADRIAMMYYTQGRIVTLDWIVAQLLDQPVRAPQLWIAGAMIAMNRYAYDRASTLLQTARAELSGDPVGLQRVAMQCMMMTYQQREFYAVMTSAERILAEDDLNEGVKGQTLRTRAVSNLFLGNLKAALADAEAAHPIYLEQGGAQADALIQQDLSVIHGLLGQTQQAAEHLQNALSHHRDNGDTSGLTMCMNNLGVQHHINGHFDMAEEVLIEAHDIARKYHDVSSLLHIVWTLGDLYRDMGDMNSAEIHYRQMLEYITEDEPLMQIQYSLSQARLARWADEPQNGLTFARQAIDIADRHGFLLESARAHAEYSMMQDPSDWQRLVELCETLSAHDYAPVAFYDIVGMMLSAVIQAGRADQLTALARQWLTNDHGLALVAIELLNADAEPILSHTFQEFRPLQNVIRLVERQLKHKEDAEIRLPERTHSLSVWTLGEERFEQNGKRVKNSAWKAKGARELFFYLLFNGPQHREIASNVFWQDDVEPEKMRNRFNTTINRIRQALGRDVIVENDNIYSINPDIEVWVDAKELAETVRQARHQPPYKLLTEDLWRRAVALYQGRFLTTFGSEWLIEYQESFDRDYREALRGLGQSLYQRRDYLNTIATFKALIKSDPFDETAYCAIMKAYSDLGHRGQIKETFMQLRDILDEELGVAPSEETQTLYEALIVS
jgi:LuxR family transcriptional regulator, maltose regulon positive regulatory protein